MVPNIILAEHDGCVECSTLDQFRNGLDMRQAVYYTVEPWEILVNQDV